jgi:PAS domain S-box-containing protein
VFALYEVSRQELGLARALIGSLVMGSGIAGMHYIGMAAMRLAAITRFSPFLVTVSILLAILFSLIALLMAFGLREETKWTSRRMLGSATVMGVAISAMHYTGMAAASFVPSAVPPNLVHAVSVSPLGNNGIAVVTFLVLGAAILTSSVDRQTQAELQRLNEGLEQRVVERTRQLTTVNEELRREIGERHRAEDALRRSEDHLRLVIDTIPGLVWSKLPDGSADFLNQRFREYTGLAEEVGLGEGWLKAIHPEDPASSVDEWRAAFAAGRPFEFEARLRRADGEYRWFLFRGEPLRDEVGKIVKWYGTTTDIEDRKRAEEALRRAAEFDEAVLKSLGEGLFTMDTNGLVTSMNPAAEELFGWSFGEMRGKKMHDLTHHHYRDGRPFPSSECVGFQVLTNGQPLKNYEDVFIRKDGTFFDVIYSIAPMRDAAGQITGQVVVFSDITERKRAEERLLESEARFRLVADSAPVMIWMSGTDKLCTYFNKPWLDFTGRSIDRELRNGWAEGVHPEDLQRCMVTYIQFFDLRKAFTMEYRLRRHDGEFRWVYNTGVPRFNPDGSFAGYIGSCIDVTEQRRAEEQLRQTQEDLARVTRVVAMGELAAAIAHEVNQPLAAIVTNANFCLRQLASATPNSSKLREAISEIVNDGARASAVISKIRGLLQKSAPERTAVDVNQIIQEVTILLRNEMTRHRVSLRTDLAADLPRVSGDPVQLQQVLINLVMNGIDAMRSLARRPRELFIKSARNHNEVSIQVQDSGAGLDPERAEHIFEPFLTTKPEGIGMGLSISRSIVESHGGRLWAESDSRGAMFQFTLPTK